MKMFWCVFLSTGQCHLARGGGWTKGEELDAFLWQFVCSANLVVFCLFLPNR